MSPARTRAMRRIGRSIVLMLAVWSVMGARIASAQDTLAKAKGFYASAAYEEALAVLDTLKAQPAAPDSSEVAAYQVFCLVALGRGDQARQAIEALVRDYPLYHPSDAQASPRVLAYFQEVRRPLLPQIIKQIYGHAKTAFEKKDFKTATPDFDRVIALIDDLGDAEDQGNADLRTLASDFRDLSKSGAAAAAAAPPPAPPPAPVVPKPDASTPAGSSMPSSSAAGSSTDTKGPAVQPHAPVVPDADKIYGMDSVDVKRPVAIARDMPGWVPANAVEAKQTYAGIVEVVIGEDGKVLHAMMRASVLASYDPALLRAAANWRFRPATKNGVAVKYRLDITIELGK